MSFETYRTLRADVCLVRPSYRGAKAEPLEDVRSATWHYKTNVTVEDLDLLPIVL